MDKKVQVYIEAIKRKAIDLRKQFNDSGEFDLLQDPNNPILFTGQISAKILILARDLGKEEVLEEEVLIGRSGQLVRETMTQLNYSLDKDYCMINLVPYKPSNNKPFSLKIQKAFFPLVQYLIKIINPDTIVVMGYESNCAILGFTKIDSILSYTRKCFGGFDYTILNGGHKIFKIVPVAHPSFFLRNGGIKGSIWRNMFRNPIEAGLNGIDEELKPQVIRTRRRKKKSQKEKECPTSVTKKDSIIKGDKDAKVSQKLIDEFVKDIEYLKEKGVKEFTFYSKWEEIQNLKNHSRKKVAEILKVKKNIWVPEHSEDYLKLEPELICAYKDKYWGEQWTLLRIFTSSAIWIQSIGRVIKFVVRDKVTGKYLGVINIASDFMATKPRDSYIGWSKEDRQKKKKLRNTCVGSTIVPLQPLGFNYLGGKLMSLLTLSNDVQNKWYELYGDKLVGVTTTSLYGSYSQYTNLKYWKKLGNTQGSTLLTPTPKIWNKVRNFVKENYPEEYLHCEWKGSKEEIKELRSQGKTPVRTNKKQNILVLILKKFGLKTSFLKSEHARGIFFARLFDNTNEFLKDEITENDLIPRADFTIEALTNLWKKRYASKRIKRLLEDKRYNKEILFYDNLFNLSWEQTKRRYLDDVGR